MKNTHQQKRRDRNPKKDAVRNKSRGRGFLFAALGIAAVALLSMALWSGKNASVSSRATVDSSGTNVVVSSDQPRSGFGTLLGKWVRPDGGYVIDIKAADEHGKLDASYLNPNPIHVERAEASGQGSLIKVFIELRDVNYPGSTYTLAYDRLNDQLKGIYYQAVQQQNYEVFFARLP